MKSKSKEILRLRSQVDEKNAFIGLMKLLLQERTQLARTKDAELAELRANFVQLERKWRDAQSEMAELNILYNLRRQSAQAGESGLRKELEMARQNLELYVNLSAAAKLRELEQQKPDGMEQIKSSMSLSRPKTQLRKRSLFVNESDHSNRLHEVYNELVNKVLAQDVAAIMYERSALTLVELESVQRCRTPAESAKNLVDIIASLPYENYECFLKALKLADQEDVYRWLAYKDYNINVEHTEAIRQHYVFLREGLDMKCSNLLEEMFSVEILNAGEKDEINAQPYMWQKNERLLSVLSRKSAEQFEMFLGALDRSGQKHIADRLREKSADNNNNNNNNNIRLGSTTSLEQLQLTTSAEQQQKKMNPKPPPPTPPRIKKGDLPDHSEQPRAVPSPTPPPPPPPKSLKAAMPAPPSIVRTSSAPAASPSSSPPPPPPPPKRSISKNSFGDGSGVTSPNTPPASDTLSDTLTTSCENSCCLSMPSPTGSCQDVLCVLVGDHDVDKTNLLMSFLYPSLNGGVDYESYIKVAPHMSQKLVTRGNVTYNLLLKDTTGQEEFDRLRVLSYSSADVFVVCFSVVKSSSFDNVRDKWIPELRQQCPRTPLVLVGTQKERRMNSISIVGGTRACQTLAGKNDAKYLECSTISREGVEEVFNAAVEAKSRANKRQTKFRIKLHVNS